MKTLKVSISQEEENQIFNSLIERFNLEKSDIWEKGQEINFLITEDVEIYATIELYQDGYLESDTNAVIITSQSVCKFVINFFIDGDEIEVIRNNKIVECIEDRINDYYRI